MAIRITLACVHISNEGVETYEPMFVDDDERYGHQLAIEPDQTMHVISADEER